MASNTSSSRSYQKPIIHARELSTSSRTDYLSDSSTDYAASTRANNSHSYHTSQRNSERSVYEPRVQKFRSPVAVDYQGNYIYSPSNKIKVIHHNAGAEESDRRLNSSFATHEDYKRTQERGERIKQ